MEDKKKNNNSFEKLEVEISEEEFARFYVEQMQKGSNIFYAQSNNEFFPKYVWHYQVLPGRVEYRSFFVSPAFKKIAVTLTTFAVLIAVSFSFLLFGPSRQNPSKQTAQLPVSAYEELISAQDKFSEFRFLDSMFAFHDAYLSFTPSRQKSVSLPALLLSVSDYFGIGQEAERQKDSQESQEILLEAGRQVAISFEPIFKVSHDSIFLSEPADPGKSLGRALEESARRIRQALSFDYSVLSPKTSILSSNLENFASDFELGSWLLGADESKKILMVFQNTAYPRATGGMIISYALLESENGYLKKIHFDDISNLDGQLALKVAPPLPLQKTSTFWSVQSANWFLDFPLSASKIAYLYEKTSGTKINGVIAINDKFVKKILNLVGSVDVLRQGVSIDGNNIDEILNQAMKNSDEANRSKRVLNDLLGLILEKIPSYYGEELIAVLSLARNSLNDRNILVWLDDDDYQKRISAKNWGGEIGDLRGDNVIVVLSRMDAGKDGALKYDISEKTEVISGGSISEAIVTIDYDKANIFQTATTSVQTESIYLRLYAPLGSELINASGDIYKEEYPYFDYDKPEFQKDADAQKISDSLKIDMANATEIYTESGKTVFGAWVKLTSEKPAKAVFKYKSP